MESNEWRQKLILKLGMPAAALSVAAGFATAATGVEQHKLPDDGKEPPVVLFTRPDYENRSSAIALVKSLDDLTPVENNPNHQKQTELANTFSVTSLPYINYHHAPAHLVYEKL